MSETKWTAGPWRVEEKSPWPMDIVGQMYRIVAPGRYPTSFTPAWPEDAGEEARANAHLIAAAPDLYEAVRDLLDGTGGSAGMTPSVYRAVAALAKARGEHEAADE